MKKIKRKNYYPSWAKYKTRDADGALAYFSHKPKKFKEEGRYAYTLRQLLKHGVRLHCYIIPHPDDKNKKDWTKKWEKSLRKIKD